MRILGLHSQCKPSRNAAIWGEPLPAIPSFPLLEKARVEWVRQQLKQTVARRFTLEISQNHFDIARELPQQLPARAAGSGRLACVGDDRDARETFAAIR